MADLNQSADQVFEEALDLSPEVRSTFLDQACLGSPDLRRQVEELFADYERLGNFLDGPLLFPNDADDSLPSTESATPLRGVLTAGTKFGRYSILEPLGSGGMGAVYRALDERLERVVAIKVLSPGLLTGDESRSRFRKEALALAKLSHAHIAAIYDVGEQDGVDYLVMECVPGETLAAKLESGPLSVKDATSVAWQIAQALEEAHEHGIIHRDLKPANVVITPKGQVKVLDFGIAKLLAPDITDATANTQTGVLVGTPRYMSPEQAQERKVDARTDLWSLGVVYYESLTGRVPFRAEGSIGVLRAIVEESPISVRQLRLDVPPLAEKIVAKALQKDPASRYQSASEMVRVTSDLLTQFSTTLQVHEEVVKSRFRAIAVTATVALLLAVATGAWLYYRASRRQWAREDAIPQINNLIAANKSLAAFSLTEKAQAYLPSDPRLQQIADENSSLISVVSSPSGATVEMQDYVMPDAPWHRLGVTPLKDIRVPKGYFLWKVLKAGSGESITATWTQKQMSFPLDASLKSPPGMVYVPGATWNNMIDFVGWMGPYKLPAYYVDRYEVTNREYQKFVDDGGYEKKEYWREKFVQDGRELSWDEAILKFHDTTDRPGPSTWVAGHFPEGQADFPVSGVSWFEASAYAAFVGKSLPVFPQWFRTAPPETARYTVPVSNISTQALTPVGTYKGMGPYGTFDMAGNVREWVANPVDDNLRFILGGSWRSPSYLYYDPEALSPFDRSDANGFRCYRNIGPMPVEAEEPVRRKVRDFSHFKPASDGVFHAYESFYAYVKTPLNAKVEGVVNETIDWREEKISFDTAYRGERMSAYLFLPKNVRPPFQTVIFFPSARVMFIPDNKGGRELGDTKFFDYVVQSGRAVMYPIYQDTYERRVKFSLPGGSQNIQLTTDWYKDVARSADYLATRSDIDSAKLAYLGVSMGSLEGVIAATLLQDRLKTTVLLDGGYFLDTPPPGGDEADFAPRMKKPVLMVNGRYDFTFSLDKSQNPLFAALGTPPENKRHIVLDTPHDVTEQHPQLVHGVLDWLDHYLGRVNK